MPILRLTDGEERLLLSVYDLWQHERLLMNVGAGSFRMKWFNAVCLFSNSSYPPRNSKTSLPSPVGRGRRLG